LTVFIKVSFRSFIVFKSEGGADGLALGEAEGEADVGATEGLTLGEIEGEAEVGAALGDWLGETEGETDGLLDGDEVLDHKTNPILADTDGDKLTDKDEIESKCSSATRIDTDSDGLGDYDEIHVHGTSACKWFRKIDAVRKATKPDSMATLW